VVDRSGRPKPGEVRRRAGIVDLHTHLLPGVDDGVRNLAEALDQLRVARDQGVDAVVCTPHVRPWPPVDRGALLADRRRIHERLTAAAEKRGDLPEIGLGSEVLILDGEVSLDAPGLRINGTAYALVEILFGLSDFTGLRELFRELLDRGYRPILAHVERYGHLNARDEQLAGWQEDGVLTQVNASSLAGEHGPEVRSRALALLAQRRIDVVASDVHGPHLRLNHIGQAFDVILERAGPETARRLFVENARAIFEGREIGRPPA
jgi:protein-tyrosine phosphatase